ncbi:MAG: nucleotidyl transferase AbiEii/AbiGii toxin family protein, partial [Patescibacteria group bacterium]
PRDLYDIHNMLRYGLFDEIEQTLLRRCVMLYSAIGAEKVPASFDFDSIGKVPQYRIKTDLFPVFRRDVSLSRKKCSEYK